MSGPLLPFLLFLRPVSSKETGEVLFGSPGRLTDQLGVSRLETGLLITLLGLRRFVLPPEPSVRVQG